MAYSNFMTLHRTSEAANALYTITLRTLFEDESGKWVGVCHELGTSAYGDTLEEAESELRDAVLLQINEMRRLGFEHEYLAQNGIRITEESLHQDAESDWSAPLIASSNS